MESRSAIVPLAASLASVCASAAPRPSVHPGVPSTLLLYALPALAAVSASVVASSRLHALSASSGPSAIATRATSVPAVPAVPELAASMLGAIATNRIGGEASAEGPTGAAAEAGAGAAAEAGASAAAVGAAEAAATGAAEAFATGAQAGAQGAGVALRLGPPASDPATPSLAAAAMAVASTATLAAAVAFGRPPERQNAVGEAAAAAEGLLQLRPAAPAAEGVASGAYSRRGSLVPSTRRSRTSSRAIRSGGGRCVQVPRRHCHMVSSKWGLCSR